MRRPFQPAARYGYYAIAGFTAFLLLCFAALDRYPPAGRRLAKIKGVDTVNYFDIAHSLFFDHDFNLNNEFTRLAPDDRIWSHTQKSGLPGSPWGVGYSLLEIPLLAAGTALDALAGRPPDGYGPAAVYLYCLGNILLTGLGLAALYTFLHRVGASRPQPPPHLDRYCLFTVFAVFFGTNVGYYAFSQIAHAATFLMVSLFLAHWWNVRLTTTAAQWFILGLLGGFLSICRWQDILYLAGPGIADLLEGMPWKQPLPWLRSRLAYLAAVAVCWIPQTIEWRVIYGKYLTMPQGAGFISFPPHYIWPVLFSSRNGWFLWTPLAVIGIAGLVYGALKTPRAYLPWIVVAALEVVVIGAMKTWHGFDSFAARYLLTNSAIVGLGLFTFLCGTPRRVRRIAASAAVACCLFTLLFAIQYRLDLIPHQEKLTARELLTDKFRLPEVRRQKQTASRAAALLDAGKPEQALSVLQAASAEDRAILSLMSRAYTAAGRPREAADAERRRQAFLDSRLD